MSTNELLNVPVRQIMSQNVVRVTRTASMKTVDDLFTEHGFHHLPVVDEREYPVGIISAGDLKLLKNYGTRLGLHQSKLINESLLHSNLAADVMSKPVITVRPDDTLERCADLLRENLFHALPVVEDGRLVGLITTYDLLITAYRRLPELTN